MFVEEEQQECKMQRFLDKGEPAEKVTSERWNKNKVKSLCRSFLWTIFVSTLLGYSAGLLVFRPFSSYRNTPVDTTIDTDSVKNTHKIRFSFGMDSDDQELLEPSASTRITISTTTDTAAADPGLTIYPVEPVKYYQVYRTDRSGSALKDYLLLHSYAFSTNNIYGGACFDAINWEPIVKRHGEKFKNKVLGRKGDLMELIQAIGLQDAIPLACPTETDLKQKRAKYIKKSHYFDPGWTDEWQARVQSISTFPYERQDDQQSSTATSKPISVAVHVRRGDMTPCFSGDRYLPNDYFLKTLDHYLPQHCSGERPCNITIYSEENSYESFEPFLQRKYNIDFHSPLPEIWKAFITADVFIMSMSAFSFVPALMKKNGRVLSPYFHWPEPPATPSAWETVDRSIYTDAMWVRAHQQTNCTNRRLVSQGKHDLDDDIFDYANG